MYYPYEPRKFAEDMVKALPQSARAHWLLARILHFQGHSDQALPHATEAVHLLPQNGRHQVLLGAVLEELGRQAEARAAFE